MTKKPTEKVIPKFRAKKTSDGVVTLSALCAELKHEPKLARAKLRAAARDAKTYPTLAKHAARKARDWEKGSAAIAEARKVLS